MDIFSLALHLLPLAFFAALVQELVSRGSKNINEHKKKD